jgi:Cellulose binding domain
VPLTEFKIRYYFTIDSASPLTFNCDYALVGCANLNAAFVSVNPIQPGTDYYLELSFTAAAGSIEPGYTSGPFRTRFNKNTWTNFNQSNDYSFDGTKFAFADWNMITLYRNGVLIWGKEPAVPTPVPTFSASPTNMAAPTFSVASNTPRPTATLAGFE